MEVRRKQAEPYPRNERAENRIRARFTGVKLAYRDRGGYLIPVEKIGMPKKLQWSRFAPDRPAEDRLSAATRS